MFARFDGSGFTSKEQQLVWIFGLLVLVLNNTACFSYRPSSTELVKPNEEIRIIVTDAAALRIQRDFSVSPPFEGRLAPLGQDSFGLAVWVGPGFSRSDFATMRQTVPILRGDILEVHRRQFSVKRTAYFTAGIVAALTVLIDRIGLIDLPWPGEGESPTPPEPDPFRRRR